MVTQGRRRVRPAMASSRHVQRTGTCRSIPPQCTRTVGRPSACVDAASAWTRAQTPCRTPASRRHTASAAYANRTGDDGDVACHGSDQSG